MVKGGANRSPNPELLFTGAYSACYLGALSDAAKQLGLGVADSTVQALVIPIEDDQGGFRLPVELLAQSNIAPWGVHPTGILPVSL